MILYGPFGRLWSRDNVPDISAQGACVGRVSPLACSHGKSLGPVWPLPNCAILVLPVHDGGLGSRLRVFPEAARPRRLSCFMLLLIRMSPMVERPPTPEVMHDQFNPECATRPGGGIVT
jgi:hypothetical protein